MGSERLQHCCDPMFQVRKLRHETLRDFTETLRQEVTEQSPTGLHAPLGSCCGGQSRPGGGGLLAEQLGWGGGMFGEEGPLEGPQLGLSPSNLHTLARIWKVCLMGQEGRGVGPGSVGMRRGRRNGPPSPVQRLLCATHWVLCLCDPFNLLTT